MTSVYHYLNSGKVRKTLTTKPGEEGFSLIELVVVVAVLAILAAIAIPQFAAINAKARASAAANTVATVAKECQVKFANGESNGAARAIATLDGYTGVVSTDASGGNTGGDAKCFTSGKIVATSSDTTSQPSFSYYVSGYTDSGTARVAGEKYCTPASLPGCDANNRW